MERSQIEEITNNEMDMYIGELLVSRQPAPFVQFFGTHVSNQRINLGQWFRDEHGKVAAFHIIRGIAQQRRPDLILFGSDARTVVLQHDKMTPEQVEIAQSGRLTVDMAAQLGLGEIVEVLMISGQAPDGSSYHVRQHYRREADGSITLLERNSSWPTGTIGRTMFFAD